MTTRNVFGALAFAGWVGLLALAGCKRGFEGVAECDAYFKAVDSCANTDEKGTLQAAMGLEKDAWKYLSRDDAKKQCVERKKFAEERCDVGPKGVAECDEYFKVMETCSNETQKNNAKTNAEQWKSRPKSTLKDACTTSLKMAKTFCK